MTLPEGGAEATRNVQSWDRTYRAAASKVVVMRSGRHFTGFTVVEGDDMMFGVTRPGWGVEGDSDAQHEDGHCFYDTASGRRFPVGNGSEGMQLARVQGDRIGLLLDFDQGSMTVWEHDERLGVMQAEGLSGPLCWAVSIFDEHYSARIESAPAPPSPTEGELAAAKAWEPPSESDDEW